MSITFNKINPSELNAGVFVESGKGAQAGVYGPARQMLVIDTAVAASVGTKLIPTQLFEPDDGHKLYGYGTPIGAMVEEALRVHQGIPVYVLAISDSAGTATTKIITFTGGSSTAAAIIKGKIGGYPWQAKLPSGSTVTQAADAAVAAIQALTKLPMSAANVAGVLTLTAKWKGAAGNNISVTEVSIATTDGVSVGISVAVTAGVSGATDPDITAAMGALAAFDLTFTQIVTSYTGDSQLDLIDSELDRRRHPNVRRRGVAFVCIPGSQGTVTTWVADRANEGMVAVAAGVGPGLPWIYAAHVAALRASTPDVLLPSLDVELPARIPVPARSEAISQTSREALAQKKVSSLLVTETGKLAVEIVRCLDGGDVISQEALGVIESDINGYLKVTLLKKRIVAVTKKPKEDSEIDIDGIAAVLRGRILTTLARYFTDPDAAAASIVVERDSGNPNAVNISFSGEIAKVIYRVHVKYTFT